VNDEELLAAVKAAAGREAAPANLAERVLDHVAYRARLEQRFGKPSGPRRRVVLCGAATIGLAAAAWLWARAPQPGPRIAAEQPKPATASAAPGSSPSSTSVVDPCRARLAASGTAPLIDDFEDGDDALAPLEERAGFWRWARESDAPGTAPALLPVPRPDASARSRLALRVKGGQLYDWGATVEVNFRPPCYDATRYSGIALSARGPGRIYVSLREVGVIPVFEGGTCERDCYNSHVAKLELGREWRDYQVGWADLRQRGIDRPALDPSRLHSIAFLIRAEDTPYDVWLDDVGFVETKR
jgi:hypothetical protein